MHEKKLRRHLCYLVFLAVLLLGGCGRRGATAPADQEKVTAARADFDWREERVRLSEEVTEGEAFQLAEYVPFSFPEPRGKVEHLYPTGIVCGDEVFYVLTYLMADEAAGEDAASGAGQKALLYQYSYNCATGEENAKQFFPDPNYTGEIGTYCALSTLIGGTEDCLYFSERDYDYDEDYDSYTLSSYQVLKTDRQRKILEKTELIEGYRQLGMTEPHQGVRMAPNDCIVSPDGCFYILRDRGNALCQVDSQGRAHTIVDYGQDSMYFVVVGKASDGTPLFSAFNPDEGCAEMFWVDGETGQKKVLSRLPKTSVSKFYVNSTGLCYYLDLNDRVISWDLATGARAAIYDLKKAGFTNTNWMEMAVDREGALRLFLLEGSEKAAVKVDPRGVEQEVTLKLYAEYTDSYFESCAASFSRKHPGVTIELEVPPGWDEREAFEARMKADVMSGQGPDMFLLDSATMRLLWEKGALADISGMLDASAGEQIWPILLESGVIDGKMAGLGTGFNITSMFVSNDVWERDTWTCMDVVELLERPDAPETLCAMYGNETDSPYAVLHYLALADLEDSIFLDLEKGECHFDSQEFVRTMEVAKKYGHLPGAEYVKERFQALRNGKALVALANGVSDLSYFSDFMANAGEDAHMVGLPTEGGNGNFLYVTRFFCVNQKSAYQDIAKEFMAYFLSKENQRKNAHNVILRRDVLEENVVMNPGSEDWTIYMGDGSYLLLSCKKDGSNYLEEYYGWIDHAKPAPTVPAEITDIIAEEAEAFFSGDRSAESVAELIQNRVKLFLAEQK